MSAIITAASPIVLALITAIVTPLMVAVVLNRTKAVDWARQDEVAAKLVAANDRVAHTSTITNEKLDVIHTLVNSNLTEQIQHRIDSTLRESVALKALEVLQKAAGLDTKETTAAILLAETTIADLYKTLADRRRQQTIVEKGLV